MSIVVWIALAFLVVVVVAGSITTTVRTIRAWRAFRLFRRGLSDGLGGILRKASDVEVRLASAGATAARLDAATARLRRTNARAAVLAAALGEVRSSARRLRGAVPRK